MEVHAEVVRLAKKRDGLQALLRVEGATDSRVRALMRHVELARTLDLVMTQPAFKLA